RAVVGRTLGWLLVKSAAFEMEHRRDSARDIYHFEGHGYGHGVGMCVIGSVNLAARGQTAAQILNRYYPGLDVVSLGGQSSAKTLVERSVEAPAPRRSAEAFALPAPSPVALAL